MRASVGMYSTPSNASSFTSLPNMTPATVNGPTPRMPTSAIAQISSGIAAMASNTRISNCSSQPPLKNPASSPSATPPVTR